MIVGELDDVFAEVCFDDAHAGGFEEAIEIELLADHRLRLDRGPYALALRQLAHVLHRVVGCLRIEDGAAARFHGAHELREIRVEMTDRPGPDFARPIAHALEFRKRFRAVGASDQHARGRAIERALQSLIGNRLFDAAIEISLNGSHVTRDRSMGRPRAGPPGG
jgi:hypothetical protein